MNIRIDILQRLASYVTLVRVKYVSASLAMIWIGLWQYVSHLYDVSHLHDVSQWNYSYIQSNPMSSWSVLNGIGIGYTNSVIFYYILQTVLQPSYYYCYVKEHGIYMCFLIDTFITVLPFSIFQVAVCSYSTFFAYFATLVAYITTVYYMSEMISSSVVKSRIENRDTTNSPHEVFHTIVTYLFTKLIKVA